MNERIKELAEQSGAVFIPASKDYFGEVHPAAIGTCKIDLKKFAELIVLECVGCVRLQSSNDEITESWVYETLASGIVEHFGVAE